MAVQYDQIGALQAAREKIAGLRNDRMGAREDCNLAVQAVDLELRRIDNRLANLAVQHREATRFAQSSSDAWLGTEMPELVRDELGAANDRLKKLTDEIDRLRKSQERLTDERETRRASLRLAQKSLDKAQTELKQVDQRISEIRGF